MKQNFIDLNRAKLVQKKLTEMFISLSRFNRTFHEDKAVSYCFWSSSLFPPLFYDVVTATEFPKTHSESTKLAPRKQWPSEPSQTVMQKLADASLLSSDSGTPGESVKKRINTSSSFYLNSKLKLRCGFILIKEFFGHISVKKIV